LNVTEAKAIEQNSSKQPTIAARGVRLYRAFHRAHKLTLRRRSKRLRRGGPIDIYERRTYQWERPSRSLAPTGEICRAI